jgi:hypothetical protein
MVHPASMFTLLAALFLGATADAQDAAVDRDSFYANEGIEAESLGTVDNGDGTWSYALPTGFDPAVQLQGAILTWSYDGQAHFSNVVTRGGERSFVKSPDVEESLHDQIERVIRIDRLGRRWRVDAIDDSELTTAAQSAAIDGDDSPSAPGGVVGASPALQDDIPDGTLVTWQPFSWTHIDCDGQGSPVYEVQVWNTDGRTQIVDPGGHTARLGSAIFLVDGPDCITAGTPVLCSGVSVRQDEVLVAAHCVSDDNNNPIPLAGLRVCRDDLNPDAGITIADVDFDSSYSGGSGSGGGTDYKNDWAILELTDTWAGAGFATTETMGLSAADDTRLGDLTKVHNLGFPNHTGGLLCTPGGGSLFWNKEVEPIAGIYNKKLRFKLDAGPGHSGGPIYHCPETHDDFCQPTELGYVIAVVAGWNGVIDRMVGPKVAYHRSAMLAFIND